MRGRRTAAEIDGVRMSVHRSFPRRRGAIPSPFRRRTWRGGINARRLGCEASVLATVHGAIRLGLDRDLCTQLARAGLEQDAVTAVLFRGSGREYGVILPTHRTWRHSRLRGLAFSVGRRASAAGRLVLVVPPVEVQRQPRLANAHRIFDGKVVPACGDADAVKRCIEEHGGEAPLASCEASLAGQLARERVFGLAFGGHLEIDLATEFTDRSAVRLRQPCWTFDWDALGWAVIPMPSSDPSARSEAAAAEARPH
ncbi:hypothetical protein [Methylobacterium symbioticum]|uniref:Uncharacterized protein n=1 Tax=Methylobacterium symbioticum TaxID=2584084 RepID=A0A509EDJ6_9HYPH|nr:hypothetical protein [Methylobacterium symbioticum]VUD72281.1 hypothetical protein MET9862_02876 [Methylobacterium symbioticum]